MLTLEPESFDWALEHAVNHGDTTMFPLPFEYHAIKHDWANVRSFLEQHDILSWTVRPHRTMLAPKSSYAFRVITQLDPLDFLVYAALLKELGSDLESVRISTAQVFSFRFSPAADGRLFDPKLGYSNFREKSEELLKANRSISHVGVADIADFYPRIYHHRLEGALDNATTKRNHVVAVMRLLKGWNNTETFGIPVGNAPSRLLAEVAISDIDEALLAKGVQFVRYNDDYRIFGEDYSQAFRDVAFLGEVLYKNHGLTLQTQKTTVVTRAEFERRFLPGPEERELDSLTLKFNHLCEELGIADWYSDIEYDDLEPEQKVLVDSLNLVEIFDEESEKEDPDLGVIRFVLGRMGQLGDDALVDQAILKLNSLHPAFPEIIGYLKKLRSLSSTRSSEIGAKILDLLSDSLISELDYYRMWALDLFTHSTEWDNDSRFFTLLGEARDPLSRRKLILAMGRAGQRHWFQSHWRNLFDEPDWPRRALLAAGSCLTQDARNHWYRSVEPRLNPLEKAVMRWAKDNPF